MCRISFCLIFLSILAGFVAPSQARLGRSRNIQYMTMQQLKLHIGNFANYQTGSDSNLVQDAYRTALKQAMQNYLKQGCSLSHVYAYRKRQESRIVLFCKAKNSREASSIEVFFKYRQGKYEISLVQLQKGFLPRSNGRPGVSMGTR